MWKPNKTDMTQYKVEKLLKDYEDADNLYNATSDPALKAIRQQQKNSACQKYNDAYTEWQKKSREIWRTNNHIIKEEND